MDAARMDRLAATVARRTNRRTTLALLSGLGPGGLVIQDAQAARAANGARCGGSGDLGCCSGRCVRKRGTHKKFCRQAPGQGVCTIEQDTCTTGSPDYDAGGGTCVCRVTSGGYSFCGRAGLDYFTDETDADCEQREGVGSLHPVRGV